MADPRAALNATEARQYPHLLGAYKCSLIAYYNNIILSQCVLFGRIVQLSSIIGILVGIFRMHVYVCTLYNIILYKYILNYIRRREESRMSPYMGTY